MALTKSYTTAQDFSVPNCYASVEIANAGKVTDGEGNKSFSVQVTTQLWKDSTKVINLGGIQNNVTLPWNNGVVSLADVYTQLKTLETWADWTDA